MSVRAAAANQIRQMNVHDAPNVHTRYVPPFTTAHPTTVHPRSGVRRESRLLPTLPSSTALFYTSTILVLTSVIVSVSLFSLSCDCSSIKQHCAVRCSACAREPVACFCSCFSPSSSLPTFVVPQRMSRASFASSVASLWPDAWPWTEQATCTPSILAASFTSPQHRRAAARLLSNRHSGIRPAAVRHRTLPRRRRARLRLRAVPQPL